MRVLLWSIDTPMIIVPSNTGVVYCNQVDGVACVQRELEGFLIPLPVNRSRVFSPEWWYKHFNRRCKGDELAWADTMEELRRSIDVGDNIANFSVEEHVENCEAWVHVAFDLLLAPDESDTQPSRRLTGVLTWENCD